MLVNKQKYEKDEVVTFKMANGDEIVAKIISEDENEYILSKPTVVIPTQTGGRPCRQEQSPCRQA